MRFARICATRLQSTWILEKFVSWNNFECYYNLIYPCPYFTYIYLGSRDSLAINHWPSFLCSTMAQNYDIFLTPMIFLCKLTFSVLLTPQNLLLKKNHPEFVVIKLSQGGERRVGGTPYNGLYSSSRKRYLSQVSSTIAIMIVELAIKAHKWGPTQCRISAPTSPFLKVIFWWPNIINWSPDRKYSQLA